MALIISYDGYGVVANADALIDDTGGSATGDWKELGGGSYSLNPDAYLYGSASIGSKYASKSGYTYIDGITALDFSGGGTEEGQYIYIWVNVLAPGPFDTLANNGFSIMIGSSTGDHYMWRVAGEDDSNGWTGGWKLFVIDPTLNAGAITTGTPDLSAVTTIGIWVDTNTSVRAESIFISQIMCAKGLKVEGTSTTMYDDIVLWAEDYTNRAAGMFQSRGQTYYSLGSLTIHSDTADTTVSASGNNIEYEKSEFWNGTIWTTGFPTTANVISSTNTGGNVVNINDINVGIAGNSSNKISIDTTTGSSYTKSGGYLKYLSTLSATANDDFSGIVFSLYDARTLGVEPYSNCTFDGSSSLTVGATASFDSTNIINGTSGVNSIITDSLEHLSTDIFNSSGSNHAVELTSIGSGTMNWNCTLTGFEAGSTGSPVTPTSTGNETIYITATSSSDLTINVVSGASVPSVRVAASFTGSVNVLAGQVTTTITVRDKITKVVIPNTMVYVYAGAGGGLTENTVIINKVLTDVNGEVSDTRSLSSNQPILGRARKSTSAPYYKTEPIADTIDSTNGLNLNLYLILDQ